MIYQYNIINESLLICKKDIYYNKTKFDSGDINICFITGHSGSGKSTMGRNLADKSNVHIELDHIVANYAFNDNELKDYGDLIYSFFKGPGKRFRYKSKKEWDEDPTWDNRDFHNTYEALVIKAFVKYSISYAKSHKDLRFIIEGIWLYLFFDPSYFDNYAFFIKGTSMLTSKFRGSKRDAKHNKNNKMNTFLKSMVIENWDYYFRDEKKINKFYQYFLNKDN